MLSQYTRAPPYAPSCSGKSLGFAESKLFFPLPINNNKEGRMDDELRTTYGFRGGFHDFSGNRDFSARGILWRIAE
jgi:hypothetical protein